ncbi:VOC family protein [Bradyrhizobium sp. BRP14]|nr:VOC family protein [Bradyrhizobium sp. BRP14]
MMPGVCVPITLHERPARAARRPDVDEAAQFYEKHFGFKAKRLAWRQNRRASGDGRRANLMLHPAIKGQRRGQSNIKLVFDGEVEAFCRRCAEEGLEFGPIHKADGHLFANAKDPCQNSISVSSRAFRKDG